jgi:hypothetical protein
MYAASVKLVAPAKKWDVVMDNKGRDYMQRAHFTVITKDGTRWDANHLSIARDTTIGAVSILHFFCSGQHMERNVQDITTIEFAPTGASWCSECDASIASIAGDGIHA